MVMCKSCRFRQKYGLQLLVNINNNNLKYAYNFYLNIVHNKTWT